MNTDILKDLSRCHAVLDEFVIDHYANLLKFVDMVKEDGVDERMSIKDVIEAFLMVGYDSGMTELNRRNPQCTIEDIPKP